MRLVGAAADSPRTVVALVECDCGVVIRQPSYEPRVRCPVCGARGHLEVLREVCLLERRPIVA